MTLESFRILSSRWLIDGPGGTAMAIYALMASYASEGRAFGPEEVERMVIAYEKALSVLALKSGDDPANRVVAETVVKIAQMGERDPEQIFRRAIAELSRAVSPSQPPR